MRTLLTTLALAAAFAASPAHASGSSSERCGSSVITIGDPITKVRNACGQPWRIVDLQNDFGASIGERWEYERTNGLAQFVIQGGKVVGIYRT
jgi:hypothetical protein